MLSVPKWFHLCLVSLSAFMVFNTAIFPRTWLAPFSLSWQRQLEEYSERRVKPTHFLPETIVSKVSLRSGQLRLQDRRIWSLTPPPIAVHREWRKAGQLYAQRPKHALVSSCPRAIEQSNPAAPFLAPSLMWLPAGTAVFLPGGRGGGDLLAWTAANYKLSVRGLCKWPTSFRTCCCAWSLRQSLLPLAVALLLTCLQNLLAATWFLATLGIALRAVRTVGKQRASLERHQAWMLRHVSAGLFVAVQRILISAGVVLSYAGLIPQLHSPASKDAVFFGCGIGAWLVSVLGVEAVLWSSRQRGARKWKPS
jgi:hypothetical protein